MEREYIHTHLVKRWCHHRQIRTRNHYKRLTVIWFWYAASACSVNSCVPKIRIVLYLTLSSFPLPLSPLHSSSTVSLLLLLTISIESIKVATSSKKWWLAGHEVGVGEVMLCICTSKKLSLISLSYYLLYNSKVLCCVALCYVMLCYTIGLTVLNEGY